MDYEQVIAPHNMRVVGAFFVNGLYKINIFFNTACTVDKYQSWGFLKQIYFCAVFCNWLCVALTASLIYRIIWRELKDRVYAFIGGLFYLLGFGTFFYCMMPLTEAFSILLFVIFLWFYRKQSLLAILPLILLIFQREYLLVVVATLSALDFYFKKVRYYLWVTGCSCLAFMLYYLLRKTVFYTLHLDYQSTFTYMWQNLMHPSLNGGEYLRQLFLGLNLFLIYIGILFVMKRRGLLFDRQALSVLLFLFVEVNVISMAGGHGNNAGRYFYLTIPLVIFATVKELKHLLDVEAESPSLSSQTKTT